MEKINIKILFKYLFITMPFFLLFSIYTNACYSQKKLPFVLIGEVKGMDSGTVQFSSVADTGFTNRSIKNKVVNIIKGKFTFTGELAYPHAFYALFINGNKSVHTEMFFLEPGNQKMIYFYDSINGKTPFIENSLTNNELLKKYLPEYKIIGEAYVSYSKKSDSLRKIYNGKIPIEEKVLIQQELIRLSNLSDSFKINYIKRNPESYVGLWQLAERFTFSGYKKQYETGYHLFSQSLKNTTAGKFFYSSLMEAKILSVGNHFPQMALLNEDGKKSCIELKQNKYTLLDFWYSHCGPCIAGFPELKEIYNAYKDKGFNIISISIDSKEYELDWHEAIKKHGLIWDHLLDKNGINAGKIFINSYPTYFLLDNEGKIIQKKINPYQLKKFLEKNL